MTKGLDDCLSDLGSVRANEDRNRVRISTSRVNTEQIEGERERDFAHISFYHPVVSFASKGVRAGVREDSEHGVKGVYVSRYSECMAGLVP